MASAGGVEYAKYECARCGRLAPKNELKLLKKWVPVSKTSGGMGSVSHFGGNRSARYDQFHVPGQTNYQHVQALVCKRCPGQFRPFTTLFKFLFKLAFWLVVIGFAGFILLVAVTIATHPH